jgi:hypothetical protein
MFRTLTITLILCQSAHVGAVEYDCKVDKKFDPEITYTADQIKKSQFSVEIEEASSGSYLSRCSFSPSANKVTCDRYQVDKIVLDDDVNIKKYYVFRNQFDVQLFSNLSFVENNGRGGIAYGKCEVVVP